MAKLQFQPDKATVDALRKKWGIKDDSWRSSVSAIVLESQSRHFQRLTEECKDQTKLTEDFVRNLFDAMKTQLREHPLLDLCSIQPMTGPIGGINWYQHQFSAEEGIPTVNMTIAEVEIMAHSRRLKARFVNKETENEIKDLWHGPGGKELVNMVVEEAFTEVAREVLGTMYNLCDNKDAPRIDYVAEGDTLATQLHRTAHKVHKQTQRAPANCVIGNEQMLSELGVEVPISNGQIQDLGVYNERYHVYFDPLFPAGKLMAWYQSDTSPIDTGLVYSPYVMFELTPTAIDPPKDMCVDPAIRMRHSIRVVRPEFFYVIDTN